NLSLKQLVGAAELARGNGARFRLSDDGSVRNLIARYAPMFLDATVDPMVTCKTPGAGKDILQASANNLYEGVTMADLENVDERHPLNSRVRKAGAQVVEDVYRIGGMYDQELREVVAHLE